MDQKKVISRMLYFNKRAFDNVFNTITSFQDQTEALVHRFAENANLMTPEGKKVISGMSDVVRTGRKRIKDMADENYRRTTKYFVPADEKQ